jgi:hemolysin activation/secretion protein
MMGLLNHLVKSMLIAVALTLSMGAAEFPPFKMTVFEQARNQENAFSAEDVPKVIPVPRVSERAYGADEQTKFPVRELIVEGVESYPELGITPEAVQDLIDRRFREAQDIELDETGFTNRDLKEIGVFLRNLIDRGGEDEDDLSALMLLMEGQEFRRGWITVEQLDGIATSVTEFYRERGFILATAFVPEQEVADGIIRLSVLEGRLGDVTVSNNEEFTAEVIAAPFNGEVGRAVTEARIEGALRRVNDQAGVRVRGSFSPGENIGETRLNLGVLEEKKWNANLLVDNHGAKVTGEFRSFATAEMLNIGDRGHRALLGVLASAGDDTSTYGIAEYELPATKDGRLRLKGSVSRNQFSVIAQLSGPTEIVGETDNYGVSGSYQALRSRITNLGIGAGYAHKNVLFNVAGVDLLSTDQKVDVFSVFGDFSQLWDEKQLLVNLRLGFDQGHLLQGATQAQESNFTKTLFTMNLLKRFSVPNPWREQDSFFNFVFKTHVQYTELQLPSVEQFALGGPNAVRAFGISDVSVDSGFYTGIELFFDLPFDPLARFSLPLSRIKPFVFFDYAYGVARQTFGNSDVQVKALGLGMRIDWPGKGTANLILATPWSAAYDVEEGGPQGESRVYVDVLYQIH